MKIVLAIISAIIFYSMVRMDIKSSQYKIDTYENTLKQQKNIPIIDHQLTLRNPLVNEEMDTISQLMDWENQRTYLKSLLTKYQYGSMPQIKLIDTVYVDIKNFDLDKKSISKLLTFHLKRNKKELTFRASLTIPNDLNTKIPVIIKNDVFLYDLDDISNKTTREYYAENKRDDINYYSINKAIEKNYALLKFIRTDIALDTEKSKESEIFNLFPEYNWGAIAAWAWAYQIIIDWLETQTFTDVDKIIATGHSRGGKVALCAAIYDERIDLVVPNASGSGGTGSWIFSDGIHPFETINAILKYYSYWWSPDLALFTSNSRDLPFDSHFNKALIAPRGLLNTCSREDYWANPYGTYLTHLAAKPFFKAYGVFDKIGVKWRNGGHNQDYQDWDALFEFSDKIFFNKISTTNFDQSPFSEYTYDSIIEPYMDELKYFLKSIDAEP